MSWTSVAIFVFVVALLFICNMLYVTGFKHGREAGDADAERRLLHHYKAMADDRRLQKYERRD